MYYAEIAANIASNLKQVVFDVESLRMSGNKYIALQGKIERSSCYSDIKMKSTSHRQFCDAFSNETDDIAIKFDGIDTHLTIPWHDIIIASQSIMLCGYHFVQDRSFTQLFWRMQPQHAHHILWQFASEYFGDSRVSSIVVCLAYCCVYQ